MFNDSNVEVYEKAISMCEGKSGNHQKLKDMLQRRLIDKLKREKSGYSTIEGCIRQSMKIELKAEK